MIKWPKDVIIGAPGREVTRQEEGYYWIWDEDRKCCMSYKLYGMFFFDGRVYAPVDPSIIPEKPEPIEHLDDGVYKLQWLNLADQSYSRYLEKRGDRLYNLNEKFYTLWEPKKFKVVAKLVEEEISD